MATTNEANDLLREAGLGGCSRDYTEKITDRGTAGTTDESERDRERKVGEREGGR